MPMKTRTRHVVATGISEDASGYIVDFGVRGSRGPGTTKRFRRRELPDPPLPYLVSWRLQRMAELDAAPRVEGPAPDRGTFASDLPRWLKTFEGRPCYKSERSHASAWLPFVGAMSRHRITEAEVDTAMAAWRVQGRKPATIRHRLRVFRDLYRVLDGRHARVPLRDIKWPKRDDPSPVAVPRALIQAVAASLKRGLVVSKRCGPSRTQVLVRIPPPRHTHVRFLIRALTGQRPCQIMRTKPDDVDFERKVWYIRAAKGGRFLPFPLDDPETFRAWQLFAAAQAWGPFDAEAFSRTLRRHGWPGGKGGTSPYALRATFGMDHRDLGADIGTLQGLYGHKLIGTTRLFYTPWHLDQLRQAVVRRRMGIA